MRKQGENPVRITSCEIRNHFVLSGPMRSCASTRSFSSKCISRLATMSAKISFCDQLGPRSFVPLLLVLPDATAAVGAVAAGQGLMRMLRPLLKGRGGWKQGKGIVPAHIQHGSDYFNLMKQGKENGTCVGRNGRQHVDIHDGEVLNSNWKKKIRIFSHSSIGVCLLCV